MTIKNLIAFQNNHFLTRVVIGEFLMITHKYLPFMKTYNIKSCHSSTINISISTYIYTYIHVYTYIYVYIYTSSIYIYMYIFISICIHI